MYGTKSTCPRLVFVITLMFTQFEILLPDLSITRVVDKVTTVFILSLRTIKKESGKYDWNS